MIDAVIALRMAARDAFHAPVRSSRLVAPRLLWTECCNVLHRSISRDGADEARVWDIHERILHAPIEEIDDFDRREPWNIASLVGWRKTYDAEYLAVARHVGGAIWTFDQQLLDGARRLGIAVAAPD